MVHLTPRNFFLKSTRLSIPRLLQSKLLHNSNTSQQGSRGLQFFGAGTWRGGASCVGI